MRRTGNSYIIQHFQTQPMKKLFVSAFWAIMALSSCQSDLVDPTDIDITAAPVVALPLGEIGLTMDHLLIPDSSLIFDDNTTSVSYTHLTLPTNREV